MIHHLSRSLCSIALLFAVLLTISHVAAAAEKSGVDAVHKPDPLNGLSIRDLSARLGELSTQPEAPEVLDAKRRVYERILEQFRDRRKKDFHVSGVVVDEQGRPLQSVEMAYGGTIARGFEPSHSDGWTKVIDGPFDEWVRGYHKMGLSFKKDGYYRVQISLSAPRMEDIEELAKAGDLPDRGVVESLNMRIVMRKIGDVVWLDHFRENLIVKADRSGISLDLNAKLNHRASMAIADLQEAQRLPEGLVYLTLPIGDDGAIGTEWVEMDINGTRKRQRAPEEVRLNYKGDDGFIAFHHDPEKAVAHVPLRDSAAWQMREAPNDGYVNQLVFTREQLRTGPFFYIRHGNLYGRGRLGPFRTSEDGTRFECRIEVKLQQEPGARNLETYRW